MRIARFAHPSGMSFGVVEGEPGALTVAQIEGHPFGQLVFTGQRWALPDVRLLSPILPSKVVGVGRNYAAHAAELGNEVPTEPLLFLKPSTTVIGPADAIRLPLQSSQVEHEAELAVVINARGAREVSRERALDSVFGYTVANDVTARDLQKKDPQWTRAKGFDSFCPLGPWIDTDVDPSDLRVTAQVDGELRQDGRTSQFVFDVATLVSYISHVMTLLPGDVILTGTPAGVGPLAAGQSVTVEVEGLGSLTNPVVAHD
ncbi:MAG: 2-hydroxyhepta-2,4-diene,7-dioate isomerase [Cryptosporangiaceae bacterium]|jgi:2-keto-4-pentenoate hydratase/2-oxohepta-3-ene-1,7-dioic acid hydratase in catechol pathway|nr:2-hydroxyhepta-2,4-diene,7-dioate isomerase [Cryptosporangiaceae bacterium]